MAGAAIAGMVRHTPARASALPARPASAQAVRGGDCIAGDLGERAWRVERRVDPTPRGGRVRTRGDVEPARRAGLLVPTGVVLTRRAPEAVARGEYLPTWPVLVQRELSPRFTGWSTIGEAAIFGGDSAGTPADARTALYDIEPVGEEAVGGKGITDFTLEAGVVLGEPVMLRWGLEG